MFKNKKLLIAIVVLVLVLVMIIRNGVVLWMQDNDGEGTSTQYEEVDGDDVEAESSSETEEKLVNEDYERLMENQEAYELRYGPVPDGFLWDSSGELLSIGDSSMTAEESMYAYFQGLSSLDIGTAQRYSRNSAVVRTYSEYFDSSAGSTDYYDSFLRNMYRECLLSLQVNEVLNTSTFAENRMVFTVSAKMLDLTNKDFWKNDEMEIFRQLYIYNLESDSTAGDMYLYDYILGYYRSDEAQLRDVTFDITCERFPDVMSGWLVSVDTDVDDACRYRDGTLVVSYIKSEYQDRGRELIDAEMHPESETVAQSESSNTVVIGEESNNGNSNTHNAPLQDLGEVDLNSSAPITFDHPETGTSESESETEMETGDYNYYYSKFTSPDSKDINDTGNSGTTGMSDTAREFWDRVAG